MTKLLDNSNKKRFKYDKPIDFPPHITTQIWDYVTEDMIPGVHDYYMISNQGLVYNRRAERLMSISPNSHGYACVHLSGTFGSITYPVHRLVGLKFVYNPNPSIYTFINHINGNKMDPRAENLEWVTPKLNTAHAIRTGLFDPQKQSKLTIEQRNEIRDLLALKKYSCRQIAEMTGTKKSIVSHMRYGETWTNEGEIERYSIKNNF